MKSLLPMVKHRDWDGVQSLWVLPAARRLYLVGAIIAVGATLLGVVIALAFQLLSLKGADTEAVPEATAVAPSPIDLAALDKLFQGPTDISTATFQLIRPVQAGAPVARLSAQSRAGVASFPEGYQLIGGRDAELVLDARDPYESGGTILVATERYAAMLNAVPEGTTTTRTLQIRVVATDRNGSVSRPATLEFAPSFDPPKPAAQTQVEEIGGPESLRAIATILASIAAQRGTPEWFDAFDYAMKQPDRCGAVNNEAFIKEYDRSLRHLKPKLTATNLRTFYSGVCNAWQEQINAARLAGAEAERARMEVIARNMAAETTAAVAQSASRGVRNTALAFAAAAVSFFMTVALFLAFLAIEGHSNAVREAVQIMARQQPGKSDEA